MNTDEILTAIDAYVKKVVELRAENACRAGEVQVKFGPRYAKIYVEDGDDYRKYVHSFVELSSGSILKAASWATPARGPRGSVLDLSKGGFTAYGAASR